MLMQGFPPHPDVRVTLGNWQDPPFNRWAFSHLRELVPTQTIRNSSYVHPVAFEPDAAISDMPVGRTDGTTAPFLELLHDTYTDGIVIMHDDRIRYEQYFGHTGPFTNHLLMSVTKSVVGCVAGILIHRGVLHDDAPLTAYVPELEGSGYAGATVRNVLDMRSGVRFSEEYTDPEAEVNVMEEAFGWRPPSHDQIPRSIYEYLSTLSRERDHGGIFDYRSAETLVLGWVCERSAGVRMADLIGQLIWTPLGALYPAELTCDSVGTGIHDGGMCASTRDLARFGQMLLHMGRLDGVDIVPSDWLQASWRVDPDIREAFHHSRSGPYLPGGWYRNQFWFLPRRHGDVLLGLGIYGQMLYVNPGTRTVAAKFSTWPDAQNPSMLSETIAAFDTIGAYLSGLSVDFDSHHEGPPGLAAGRDH
ncbi:MAG: serine hydrolase [Candidatus Nanopelagicales bacterium]